jgi:hypothetical protein
MALLSFVESAPRAYRLKVGNADLFRNSTEPGTSPLIVTGTVLLILGLIGLALFSPRDVDNAEDPLDDRPKLSDKETQ